MDGGDGGAVGLLGGERPVGEFLAPVEDVGLSAMAAW
jgi:hypothetical protein